MIKPSKEQLHATASKAIEAVLESLNLLAESAAIEKFVAALKGGVN